MEYRFRDLVRQLTAWVAGILVSCGVSLAAAGVVEKPLALQVALPEGAPFALESLLGSIEIAGGGAAGTVRITGRAVAEAGTEAEAKALLDAVGLEKDEARATVHVAFPLDRAPSFYPPRESEAARRVIEGWVDALAALVSETRVSYEGRDVRIGRARGSAGIAVHLVVTIPDGVDASFDLAAGSIKVARARGRVRAHVAEGRLLAEQTYGNLELRTDEADVTLRTFRGESLKIETTTGNVSLADADARTASIVTGRGGCEASRLTGDAITATTAEGDLFLDGMEAQRYELSTVSGTLTLLTNLERSPKGRLKSGSGDVLVRVGRNAPFRMEIATVSGGIRAEGASLRVTKEENAATVERGTGGGEIRIETRSGAVRVEPRA
jgi:hypothetical protein